MASVTLNGNTYSDTGAATGRDLVGEDRRGHTRWLMPMLADAVADLGAKQSACAAAVSSALAHVTTAQDWAIKTAGPVSGGEYSAKYHAQAAAGSASTAGGHAAAAASSAQLAAMNTVLQRYSYSDATAMAEPDTGVVRLNSITLASVTAIALDDQTADTGNPNIRPWLLTFDDSTSPVKGQLVLREIGSPANFAVFNVTALTAQSGWVQLTVTHVASGGSFTSGDALVLDYHRSGDAGSVTTVNGKGGAAIILTADDVGAESALADATTAEMQAGTVTELRAMSPKNVADAIASLAPKGLGSGAASAAGSVVLTAASPAMQSITPDAFGRTVTLPDARTLAVGVPVFGISNAGNYPVLVLDNGGALLGFVDPQAEVICSLADKSTAAGVWQLLGASVAGVDAHAWLQLPSGETSNSGRVQVVEIDGGRSLILYGGNTGIYAAIYSHAAGGLAGSTVLVRAGDFNGQCFIAARDVAGEVLLLSCTRASTAFQAVILSVVGRPAPAVNTPVSRTLVSAAGGFSTETQGLGLLHVGGAWVCSYLEGNAGRLLAMTISGTTVTLGAAALAVAGGTVAPVLAATPVAGQFIAFRYNSGIQATLYSVSGTTIASMGDANGSALTTPGGVILRAVSAAQWIAVGINGTATPVTVFTFSAGALSARLLSNAFTQTGFTWGPYLHVTGPSSAVLSAGDGSSRHVLTTITISGGVPAAAGEVMVDCTGGTRQVVGMDESSLWLSWQYGSDFFARYSGGELSLRGAVPRDGAGGAQPAGQMPSISGDWMCARNHDSALSAAGRYLSWRSATRLMMRDAQPVPAALPYGSASGIAVFSGQPSEVWTVERAGWPAGGNRNLIVKRYRIAEK